MELNKQLNVFNGRRVLVTGDTGFKGSWLCLWLCHLGAKVAGFSLPPTSSEAHYAALGLQDKIRHTDGDVRVPGGILDLFEDFQPEILFHLAAQPLVRASYQDPKYTCDVNVGGGINLLEAVRTSSSLRSVVFITSDKCYRNKEWIWGYRENDELGGHDLYSASKAAIEIIFASYFDSFFRERNDIGLATARAGNVIGGGDWSPDRIVPDCIRALEAGQDIRLRNPASTRPWQHVLEPLSGYLLLAANLLKEPQRFSGAWNFGPPSGDVFTVQQLAETAAEVWGSGKVVCETQARQPAEAGLLQLNCDKAHAALHWRPRWPFHKAVGETVRWYKAASEGQKMWDVGTSQIADYTATVPGRAP